ncbi:DUF817 domain-containing protein [Salinispora sp. H7-4]|uniref:DUF817 domain-containing protein n=1 Tax=Salinispora sp. H7-4 TaxID=2748321 RepID=UPI0015D402FB|nr:DUF817 domain-containing protein [Salinispora sp. H7-4]NYT93242.1 DUF817 domain-containing protein [Salinispora sp. H7-4]
MTPFPSGDDAKFTGPERVLDRRVHAWLEHAPRTGWRAWAVELVAFTAKQAWACVFGAAMLAVVVAARLWWPDDAVLARNDALTLAALAIQVVMVTTRLETLRELRVVVLFHLAGTTMEIFKTEVGSWAYADDGVLRLGQVPLFSGFMYAAVGSYLVRVYRLFDLRFDRYPRQWLTAVAAAAIYVNFFTHHYLADLRWLITVGVVVVFGRCVMHFRVFRRRLRMPVLCAFGLVAVFIWLAENISTWAHAWTYPNQAEGWHPVSASKLGSWFLLMIISVVLVAWVYPPRPVSGLPGAVGERGEPEVGVPGHPGSRPASPETPNAIRLD